MYAGSRQCRDRAAGSHLLDGSSPSGRTIGSCAALISSSGNPTRLAPSAGRRSDQRRAASTSPTVVRRVSRRNPAGRRRPHLLISWTRPLREKDLSVSGSRASRNAGRASVGSFSAAGASSRQPPSGGAPAGAVSGRGSGAVTPGSRTERDRAPEPGGSGDHEYSALRSSLARAPRASSSYPVRVLLREKTEENGEGTARSYIR
jgi:hypothetical protein